MLNRIVCEHKRFYDNAILNLRFTYLLTYLPETIPDIRIQ